MTTLAWFHCFAGIAGDMALASLIDAGADIDEVRRLLDRLPVAGWAIDAEAVLRAGVAATHLQVKADDKEFTARVRLDTPREREYLRHGGILPFVLRRLLA